MALLELVRFNHEYFMAREGSHSVEGLHPHRLRRRGTSFNYPLDPPFPQDAPYNGVEVLELEERAAGGLQDRIVLLEGYDCLLA